MKLVREDWISLKSIVFARNLVSASLSFRRDSRNKQMKADKQFLKQSKRFWACVRLISQETGYTQRGTKKILVPDYDDMLRAMKKYGVAKALILDKRSRPNRTARKLRNYFKYRSTVLNDYVEPRLMDVSRAKKEFTRIRKALSPTCPLPMNKQKGKKKVHAYFTGIINMLIEKYTHEFSCDYDPRKLITVTRDGMPLRTMARRVDGAFPGTVSPVAVWEIKEYYFTTTFGSRVADGVYETLLDGLELEELRKNENFNVLHYLMVDSHYTWWECGRSYLCRIVDMLHMGYIDEVLFGYEVVEELPGIVSHWVDIARSKKS